jgi:hypothetical protein
VAQGSAGALTEPPCASGITCLHHVVARSGGAALQGCDGAAHARTRGRSWRARPLVWRRAPSAGWAARCDAAWAPQRRLRSGSPPPRVAAAARHWRTRTGARHAVGRRVCIGAGDHAAECWQARLARRGATRRSAVHGGRAGEAAGGAQARRLARRAALSCNPHGSRGKVGCLGGGCALRIWASLGRGFAIKDGEAVAKGYGGHEGHACGVEDRVWEVASRVSRFAGIGGRMRTVSRQSRGQNSGPLLTQILILGGLEM